MLIIIGVLTGTQGSLLLNFSYCLYLTLSRDVDGLKVTRMINFRINPVHIRLESQAAKTELLG